VNPYEVLNAAANGDNVTGSQLVAARAAIRNAKKALTVAILSQMSTEGWTIGEEFLSAAQARFAAAFAAWCNGDERDDVNAWLGHCTPSFIVDGE
jgi:hypothetical protein